MNKNSWKLSPIWNLKFYIILNFNRWAHYRSPFFFISEYLCPQSCSWRTVSFDHETSEFSVCLTINLLGSMKCTHILSILKGTFIFFYSNWLELLTVPSSNACFQTFLVEIISFPDCYLHLLSFIELNVFNIQ